MHLSVGASLSMANPSLSGRQFGPQSANSELDENLQVKSESKPDRSLVNKLLLDDSDLKKELSKVHSVYVKVFEGQAIDIREIQAHWQKFVNHLLYPDGNLLQLNHLELRRIFKESIELLNNGTLTRPNDFSIQSLPFLYKDRNSSPISEIINDLSRAAMISLRSKNDNIETDQDSSLERKGRHRISRASIQVLDKDLKSGFFVDSVSGAKIKVARLNPDSLQVRALQERKETIAHMRRIACSLDQIPSLEVFDKVVYGYPLWCLKESGGATSTVKSGLLHRHKMASLHLSKDGRELDKEIEFFERETAFLRAQLFEALLYKSLSLTHLEKIANSVKIELALRHSSGEELGKRCQSAFDTVAIELGRREIKDIMIGDLNYDEKIQAGSDLFKRMLALKSYDPAFALTLASRILGAVQDSHHGSGAFICNFTAEVSRVVEANYPVLESISLEPVQGAFTPFNELEQRIKRSILDGLVKHFSQIMESTSNIDRLIQEANSLIDRGEAFGISCDLCKARISEVSQRLLNKRDPNNSDERLGRIRALTQKLGIEIKETQKNIISTQNEDDRFLRELGLNFIDKPDLSSKTIPLQLDKDTEISAAGDTVHEGVDLRKNRMTHTFKTPKQELFALLQQMAEVSRDPGVIKMNFSNMEEFKCFIQGVKSLSQKCGIGLNEPIIPINKKGKRLTTSVAERIRSATSRVEAVFVDYSY